MLRLAGKRATPPEGFGVLRRGRVAVNCVKFNHLVRRVRKGMGTKEIIFGASLLGDGKLEMGPRSKNGIFGFIQACLFRR